MQENTHSNERSARWPGVLLSCIVPGFGLVRSGRILRGILWYVGVQLAFVIPVLIFAAEGIPMAVGFVALFAALCVEVVMLCDSFRHGQMTIKLWIVFALMCLLSALFISTSPLLLRHFAFTTKIQTAAMEPTLHGPGKDTPPDHVIVNRWSYLLAKPKRGDIVAFSTSSIPAIMKGMPPGLGEVYYVKRIVGLPGERIEIKDGSIIADGKILGRAQGLPDIHYVATPNASSSSADAGGPYFLNDSEYFVLGDNSPRSADSRLWGGIPTSSICGKVTKIYYPLKRIGMPK